jgi:hypothetical protein
MTQVLFTPTGLIWCVPQVICTNAFLRAMAVATWRTEVNDAANALIKKCGMRAHWASITLSKVAIVEFLSGLE